MKRFKLFNWSLRAGSSPNQTNDTQSREYRNGVVPYLFRTLTLLIVLFTIGVGQMWGTFVVPEGGKTVYLCIGDFTDWNKDPNTFGICVQNGGSAGEKFAAFTPVAGTSYMYVGTIPAGTWSHIFFLRCASSWTTGNGWTNAYNKCTKTDWANDDAHTVIRITGWDDSGTWHSAYKGGETLYLKTNSAWTTSNATFQAKFWTSGSASTVKYEHFTLVEEGSSYYSLTIPVGGWTDFRIERLSSGWGTLWNYTNGKSFSNSNNCIVLPVSCSSDVDGTWETVYSGLTATVTPAGKGSAELSGSVGSSVTATASDPATGYEFHEWSSSNGSFASTTSASTTFTPTANNAVATATFSLINYTITYDLDGGTNHASNPDSYTYETAIITLKDPTKDGYTFEGWYTNSEKTTEGHTIPTNSTGNKKFWAKWSEHKSDITIQVSPATCAQFTTPASVSNPYSLGIDTHLDVVAAETNNGYYFTGWTKVGAAVVDNESSASTTIRTNGTKNGTGTATANFSPRFAVIGSDKDDEYGEEVNGMPGWGTYTKTLDYVAANDWERTLILKGNTEYKFSLWNISTSQYLRYEGTNWITLNTTADCWLNNTKADIKFSLNGSDEVTFKVVSIPESYHANLQIWTVESKTDYYTATFAYQTFFGDETTSTSVGGSVSAVDWKNFELTSDQKAKAGTTVTITATPSDGYSFAGWYSNAACTTEYVLGEGETKTDNVITIIGAKDAAKAVYAKFTENMTTINLVAENGSIKKYVSSAWSDAITSIQVGVHTKPKIKAVPANGYFFTGWERTAGTDYNLGAQAFETEADSIVNNLTGLGAGATSGQTLTAKFEQLEKIYFKNDINGSHWANVYVFFDVSWNDHDNCAKTSSNNTSKNLHVAMQRVNETSYVYWAYVPRYFTTLEGDGSKKVAFADYDQATNNANFNPGSGTHSGAMRSDYNKALNMFVPYRTKKVTGWYTDYYSNGYWMNYGKEAGEESGYTLKRWRQSTNNYRTVGELLTTSDPNIIKYRFRVDSLISQSGRSYYDQYIIQSAGNIKYKASSTITISACSNVTVSEDNGNDSKFVLTPTRLGYYVITIDQNSDQMKLSVDYPLAVNDYILEHKYTTQNYNSTADTVITTYSDVIKKDSAANMTRYSMFLSKNNAKGGSPTRTLKLLKCTALSASGVPTWSSGDATNLYGILTKVNTDGNGVYQFDLKVNTSNHQVDEVDNDSTRLYTGKYYIKTDTVTGGWINYKLNGLAHNTHTFKAADSTTFDYYYCHYFYPKASYSDAAKLKCIIANDYCEQLCDTLNNDGIAYMDGTEAKVRVYQYESKYKGTSVRFSYNSTTNKLRRAYLAASEDDQYLGINVSVTGKVYKAADGTTDLYNGSALNCRFDDTEDWVYEKNVKAVPVAKGGVKAIYDGKTQILLPDNHILLGGTSNDPANPTKYDINLVYDFKTNYLIATWIPGGTITEKLSDVDMLWERQADNAATAITFSGAGALTNVKVVAAIRFDYNKVHKDASGQSGWVDLSDWTTTSRPHLKYFVSFPFDVPVSSVFGLANAKLGRDYVIQKYNGAKRAKEGLFFGDDGNFWEDLTKDSVMHANEGYCVIFDNDYVRGLLGNWWAHKGTGSHVHLYFPANDTIAAITGADTTVIVAQHKCNINRTWLGSNKNHILTDSHWNLIGSPKFQNAYIKSQTTDTAGLNLTAYYYLDNSDNTWKTKTLAEDRVFKAMHSYWVQWAGKITWTTTDPGPASAPARNHKQAQKLSMKLNLMYNGNATDWTYVEMAEKADEDFKLCEDLGKVFNQYSSHIYTYAGDYDVAYNKLPISTQTVRVGVDIYRNGTYTFAMPDNFDGVVVLVDKVTGTRTNLAAGTYEVYLNKGAYNDRFSLEFNIKNTPTSIDVIEEGSSLKENKAHKFIQNGQMYILRNGEVYDARGAKIK